MKWLLVVALISAIMLIAFAVSEQYKEKFDFYDNLKNFLTKFKINLAFRQEKIIEFLNKTKPKKQFKIFIEGYKRYLATGDLNLGEIKILEPQDQQELENIVQNIGKYDAKNEISQLDSFLCLVDERLAKAKQDKEKLCPMIIKLSLLFAIGLAIVLI